MPEPSSKRPLILSQAARQDIRDILIWSSEHFGEAASLRYRLLLIQSLRDIEDDPTRSGSRDRPELAPGARTYHLTLSRSRVSGQPVRTPRHFILYRIAHDAIEIGRILHDRRDLPRHLPENFKP